jgi:hypothetical protein
MTGSTPERAARDLIEAERRIRQGAELTLHRRWWWYPLAWAHYALIGAGLDVPFAWSPIPVFASLVPLWLAMRASNARQLAVPVGWRTWLWVLPATGAALACGYGAGLVLRGLGVPLPFTGGGLLLGIVVSLVAGRVQRRGGYVAIVSRGRW